MKLKHLVVAIFLLIFLSKCLENKCQRKQTTNPNQLQLLLITNWCVRCRLADADLAGKDLAGANLQGANLLGSNLITADLRGANLRGAKLPDLKQISNSIYLDGATMPDGTIYQEENTK